MAEQLLNATDYAELVGVEAEYLHETASIYRYVSVASPTGGVTQQWQLQQANIPAGRELLRHPIPYSFVNGQYTVVIPLWLEFGHGTDIRNQDRVLYSDGTWYQVLGQPGATTDEIYRRAWAVVLLPGGFKPASLSEPTAEELHATVAALRPEPGVNIPLPGVPPPASPAQPSEAHSDPYHVPAQWTPYV
jgi:hypothetical protein